MLNGDISNKVAPVIAFRVDDFLIEYKELKFKDKLINRIFGKERKAELNPKVLNIIGFIFKQTDMSVDLVVDRKNYNNRLLEKLEDVPYNKIWIIDKEVEVAMELNIKNIDYYVDDNKDRLSKVGHKGAITLNDLYLMIR